MILKVVGDGAHSDLAERVIGILRGELNRPTLSRADLVQDAALWRSGNLINLIFIMEDAFAVTFTSEQMETIVDLPTLLNALGALGCGEHNGTA